jgi:hypothetical protein
MAYEMATGLPPNARNAFAFVNPAFENLGNNRKSLLEMGGASSRPGADGGNAKWDEWDFDENFEFDN